MFAFPWRKLLLSNRRPSRVPYRRAEAKPRRSCRLLLELLEDRTAPATLTVDATGALTYNAGPGVANDLRISLAGGTYTFNDNGTSTLTGLPETIMVSGAGSGSFMGSGTSTVTGPESAVSSISINLGDQADKLTLMSLDAPLTSLMADGGGNAGDTAVFAGGVTIPGGVSLTSFDSIQVNKPVSAGGAVTLTANSIQIADPIQTTSGGKVTLAAGGALSFMATGTINSGGDVSLSSGSDTTLNTLTATGKLTVKTNGMLTQMDGTAVTASGLLLEGTGSFTLNQTGNAVGTLSANVTGPITYRDMNALIVGSITTQANNPNGINNPLNNLTLHTGGLLTLGDGSTTSVNAAGATASLQSDTGGVKEDAKATLSSANLLLLGTGKFDLSQGSNDIDTLAANVTGPITLQDSPALTVGTVSTTVGTVITPIHGITSVTLPGNPLSGSVSLTGSDSIQVKDQISASDMVTLTASSIQVKNQIQTTSGGTVTLTASGAVSFTAGGTIASTGDVSLSSDTDTTFGGLTVTGKLVVTTKGALMQSSGTKVTATGSTTLTAGGALSLAADGTVTSGGDVSLSSGTDTTLSGLMVTGKLAATSGGALTVTSTGVTTKKGGIALTSGKAMTVDANLTAGSNGDITLSSGDTMTLAANVTTDTGTVQLNASGSLTLGDAVTNVTVGGAQVFLNSTGVTENTNAALMASSLLLEGTGSFNLGQAGNAVGTLAAKLIGSITLQDSAALIVGSIATENKGPTNNDLTLCTTIGDLTIDDPINVGKGTVRLSASAGGVQQTSGASITAGRLGVLAAGDVKLDAAANKVPIFAAKNSGPGNVVHFLAAGDLTVDTVKAADCFSGATGVITKNGEITLTSGNTNTVTVDQNVTTGSSGNITLTSGKAMTVNANVTTGSNSNIALISGEAMTVAANVTTDTGTVQLNASGLLTLGDLVTPPTITVGGATVILNSAGVTENLNAALMASGLLLEGTGSFTLTQTGNAVGTIAANVIGPIAFQDSIGLTVDTVALMPPGITTNGGDVTLCNLADDLMLNAPVDADGGTVRLSSSAGGVQQMTGGLITAGRLGVLAAGDVKLDSAANKVPIFAAKNSGPGNVIHFLAAGDLTVDTVTEAPCFSQTVTGVTTTNGEIMLTSGKAMTVDANVTASSKGDITLSSGDTMTLNADVTTSSSGNITLTSGKAMTVAANVTTDTGIVQLNPSGLLTLGDPVTKPTVIVGGAKVILNSAGVTENLNAALMASGLLLLGTGSFTGPGSFDLSQAGNAVGTLAAKVTGSISYQDKSNLTVGSVPGVDGIITNGGDLMLHTAGLLTLGDGKSVTAQNVTIGGGKVILNSAGVMQNTNSTLTASSLLLLGMGSYTFRIDQANRNDVQTLAAMVNGSITYQNLNTLDVGAVSCVKGINTSNSGDLTLCTMAEDLTIDEPIDVGDMHTVRLDSAGGVIQKAVFQGGVQKDDTITAGRLGVFAKGDITLDVVANNVPIPNHVSIFAANNSAAGKVIDFLAAGNLTVAAVSSADCFAGATGVSTKGGDVILSSGGTMTVGMNPGIATSDNNLINTNGGNLTLQAGGLLTLGDKSAITENVAVGTGTAILNSAGVTENTNSALTASALLLRGAGSFILAQPGNNVSTLAASVTGSINYRNSSTLTVASVPSVGGINGITTNGGDLTLQTGGLLTLAQNVTVGVGTVTSNSAAGVIENANVDLTGANLLLLGTGSFTLNQPGNNVNILAANVNGAITFQDASSLTVGTVSPTVGISPNGGNLVLTITTDLLSKPVSTGDLTVNEPINTGGGNITFNVGHDLTVGQPINAVNQTNTVGGSITFTVDHNLTVNQTINAASNGVSGAFLANVGQTHLGTNNQVDNSQVDIASIQADIEAGSAVINGGGVPFGTSVQNDPNNRDKFEILPSMRTPITVYGGLPTDLPGDSLALYSQDFLKSEKVISNLQYIPEKDLDVNTTTNPMGVLNHRGMFTSDHATLFYFGIENIGGLTLKAFSTQVAPQVSAQQFEVGVTASLSTLNGINIPLQALPMVPQTVINPFVVAPQFADPTGAFSAPSLAVGDVNGDGTPELIVGNGIGLQPVVTVYDVRSLFVNAQSITQGGQVALSLQAAFPLSSASILNQFFAYDSRFRGGVWVAAGKLDTDKDHVNKADIITGPGDGIGSQPLVEVWQNTADGQGVNMKLRPNSNAFLAYEPGFTGGVRVAVGNITGQSVPDIITAPGSGRAPTVEVFSGAAGAPDFSDALIGLPNTPAVPLLSFFAYDPSFTGGVFIAVGNYDQRGKDDILTGPGLGAPAEIKVFSGDDLSVLADLVVFQPPFPGAVTPFPGDSHWTVGVSGVAFGSLVQMEINHKTVQFLEIVVGSGAGQHTLVRVIQSVPKSNTILFSMDLPLVGLPDSVFGAFVAGFEAGFVF